MRILTHPFSLMVRSRTMCCRLETKVLFDEKIDN